MGSTSAEALWFRWAVLSRRKGDSGFVCAGCVWHGHRQTNLGWKEMRLNMYDKSKPKSVLYSYAKALALQVLLLQRLANKVGIEAEVVKTQTISLKPLPLCKAVFGPCTLRSFSTCCCCHGLGRCALALGPCSGLRSMHICCILR